MTPVDKDNFHKRKTDSPLYKWVTPILVPICASLIGGFGVYQVMQYRVDQLEKKVEKSDDQNNENTTQRILNKKEFDLVVIEIRSTLARIESDVKEVKIKQDQLNNKFFIKVSEK